MFATLPLLLARGRREAGCYRFLLGATLGRVVLARRNEDGWNFLHDFVEMELRASETQCVERGWRESEGERTHLHDLGVLPDPRGLLVEEESVREDDVDVVDKLLHARVVSLDDFGLCR